MRSIRTCCFPVLLFLIPLCTCAQRAKYFTLPGKPGKEEIRIAGKLGNKIHLWSMPLQFYQDHLHETTLSLHILTADLILADEKKIVLGKSFVRNLDFQFADSVYYAHLFYNSGINKRMLLKIDRNGNVDDVTNMPSSWKSHAVPKDGQGLGFISRNSSSLFVIKTETGVAEDSLDTNELVILPGEKVQAGGIYKKLILRKANRINGQVMEQQSFASSLLDFSKLIISANDSAVLACAFAQPAADAGRHNPYNGNYLFISRLDTNLAAQAGGTVLLKLAGGKKNEYYAPESMYTAGKNQLIISKGRILKQYYSYGGRNNGGFTPPAVYNYYITSSLRLTLVDERNRFLLDTIIESLGGRESLELDNYFVSARNDGADIFCIHQYSASKNGITHFSIGKDGQIDEKEMMVNEDYLYGLGGAYPLENSALLIPYHYRRTNGIMKLQYAPAE